MSAEETNQDIVELVRLAPTVGRVVAMLRWLVGLLVSCIVAMAAVVVWVNGQTTGLVLAQASILAIEQDRKAVIAEWTVWRRAKDDNDVKFLALLEGQQRLLERHQNQLDRLGRE